MLVLGGTRFVGPPIVDAAVQAGWHVTTFNRGQSGPDAPGVEALHGDRTIAGDVYRLAAEGQWDVAVDLSGYVPRETLALCAALEKSVDRYVFMSTVSVYEDWPVRPLTEASRVLECPPDAGPDFGVNVEDGPTKYGYQKAGCENAARLTFGADRTTVIRPGVVLGPREYVGRLPWWLARISHGGRVIAPGSPERNIQPIDVRDLAQFCLHIGRTSTVGTFNATAPTDAATFGGFLDACAKVTASNPEFVWIPDEDLLACGVRQWSEMPLWRTFPGVWAVDASSAYTAGLSCRPIDETVRDTWDWMGAEDFTLDDERAGEVGIASDREAEILTAYR